MNAKQSSQHTTRFVNGWAYVSLGITVLMVIALSTAFFWQRLLLNRSISVAEGESVTLPTINLKQSSVGALRVDVVAMLPSGVWVTYEIRILDAKGNVIASAAKNAWSETGRWQEEGESGTWAEEDSMAGLDLRASKPEPITIAITVRDHTTPSGQEIATDVPFQVKVYTGVIDDRYLWAGFIGTLCTSLLIFWSVPSSGRRFYERRRDSDVTQRLTVGGGDRLLRIVVNVRGDRHTPQHLRLDFTINDANGTALYRTDRVLRVSYRRNNHNQKITGATASDTQFLLIKMPGSYGFHASITPDASIDATTLIVYQDARTLIPVPVVELAENP